MPSIEEQAKHSQSKQIRRLFENYHARDMPLHINTIFSPKLLPDAETLGSSIVLVIDVFRATTTIASALEQGATEIHPVGSLSEAEAKVRELRGRFGEESVLLCGERDGIKPEGFNFGNSPLEYTRERVEGKILVMTTTNGTLALEAVKAAPLVLAASFANLKAIVNFTVRYLVLSEARASEASQNNTSSASPLPKIQHIQHIQLLCAGNEGGFSYEDTLCAGALASAFVKNLDDGEGSIKCTDATLAAQKLWETETNKTEALRGTQHAQNLALLGFADDVQFSAQLNTSRMIPLRRADGALIHWHNPLQL